jgi:hypothetical protein
MRNLLTSLYFAACMPITASAATFSVLCDNSFEVASQACTIQLSGRIEQGDASRLRSVIGQNLPDGWRYGAVLLESPGGSVSAALEVAEVVRKAMLDTTTYRLPKDAVNPKKLGTDGYQTRRKCVSACFLIWVAGSDRSAFTYSLVEGGTSDIGLHRPYLDKSAYEGSPEKVAERQQQVMLATAEYLKREQVPQALIEKMLQRASTQVYWLTDEDPDITGRSPWFEEMMIARCGYDPTYDRETAAWVSKAIDENSSKQRAAGKKKLTPADLGPRYAKYIEWRQQYNACEYNARALAQKALRQ